MSFKKDHPNYKEYSNQEGSYFYDMPISAWSEIESLIVKAGGEEGSYLYKIVTRIAAEAGAGTVRYGDVYNSIPEVVSKIRQKVKKGKFEVLMDCLALLSEEGDLGVDVLNEFMEDNDVGYRAYKDTWKNQIYWDKVDDEALDDNLSNDTRINNKNSYNAIIDNTSEKEDEGRMMSAPERANIFISHRSSDEEVAEMILDFLKGCGIPGERIFCSSLPGNDVKEKIGPEVKGQMKDAAIIILLLSKEYYESSFCLNEAGIAWYLDDIATIIPIGVRDIGPTDMKGFLDSSYKLRRLDSPEDIAYIYDEARKCLNIKDASYVVITNETTKLTKRYNISLNGYLKESDNNDLDLDFGDLDEKI